MQREPTLIPRYTREEMGRVWSDANKYSKWLDVELAATATLAEAGQVPPEAAATIRSKAKVDATRINEIEARVKHDVIAFTMNVGESIGEDADPECVMPAGQHETGYPPGRRWSFPLAGQYLRDRG